MIHVNCISVLVYFFYPWIVHNLYLPDLIFPALPVFRACHGSQIWCVSVTTKTGWETDQKNPNAALPWGSSLLTLPQGPLLSLRVWERHAQLLGSSRNIGSTPLAPAISNAIVADDLVEKCACSIVSTAPQPPLPRPRWKYYPPRRN